MGMITIKKGNRSAKLIDAADEAFFHFVLPLLKKKYPESLKKFFVNITSSVAYGVADEHSDIDIFILFRNHRDYLKYHKKFDSLIKSIKFPEKFNSLCDKGIRFELESLKKSDISSLFEKQTTYNWLRQTEWLLCWLVNSITIYDPNEWMKDFRQKAGFFPKKILKLKVKSAFVQLLNYIRKFKNSINEDQHKYLKEMYFFKCIKKLMDIIYWINNAYTPHPKWQFYILKYLGNNAKEFHKEINSSLMQNYSFKLNIIKKWVVKIGKVLVENKLLDKNIYIISENIAKSNVSPRIKKSRNALHYNGRIYFKNYLLNEEDLNIIKTILNYKKTDIDFFLPEETGIEYLGKSDYDSLMRVQSKCFNFKLKPLKVDQKVFKKIISYLNFILWRKIRVIESSVKRKNLFNQMWYSNQVVEHFIEIILKLKKIDLPNESIQLDIVKKLDFFKDDIKLLMRSFNVTIEKRINLYWAIFHNIQKYIKRKMILTEFNLNNPLIIQFDIEYWKYENARL